MELVDVLRQRLSPAKVANQNEFKKAKETSYLTQSKQHYSQSSRNRPRSSVNSHRPHSHHFLINSLNYAIIYLVLICLICKVNGKTIILASYSNPLISIYSFSNLIGKSSGSCNGRVRLTQPHGFITDGKNNYSPDLQCTFLIDASHFKSETLIRLKFIEFETECLWDFLYIFSGDSIFSQLVAAFSGVLIKRGQNELPEIEIRSKFVYLYFYSDTAFNMSG